MKNRYWWMFNQSWRMSCRCNLYKYNRKF